MRAYSNAESAEFVARNALSASGLSDESIISLVEDMLKGNKFAGQINVPILVIGGEKDIVEPVDRLRKEVLGSIDGAELTVVKGSEHLLPLEAPALVARHIENFVAQVF